MIYIFHGDDQVSSRKLYRQKIDELLKNGYEKVEVDGKKVTSEQLELHLQTQSLFNQKKFVLITHFLSRKASKDKKQMGQLLTVASEQLEILLWEQKRLTPSQLKLLSDSKVQEAKISKQLFSFLDNIGREPSHRMILQLDSLLQSESVELVSYMIAGRIQQLVHLSSGVKLAGPSWQTQKLTRQLKTFEIRSLKKAYQQLLVIDADIKSGESLVGLKQRLDLWLMQI